jgi:hypothetical protein
LIVKDPVNRNKWLYSHVRRDKAARFQLEPIFEADLPPEIYAYRAGRVGAALGTGMRQDVFTADLVVQGVE